MDWKAILASLVDLATSFGVKLIAALLVLVIGIRVIKSFKKWLKKSSKLDKLDMGFRTFLASFSSVVLYILLVITIASIIGIPATSFITILASGGVAIGLALQGSLSNFAGGLMILFFKPFIVGDYIEANGESGTVTDISVVYTKLLTPDNKKITIPNGTLMNSNIKNYSSEPTRRVDFTFTAEDNADTEKVKNILVESLTSHELALKEPAYMVKLTSCSEGIQTFTARVWVKNSDYWTVYFDVLEAVKIAFDKNGIVVPHKKLDVFVENK